MLEDDEFVWADSAYPVCAFPSVNPTSLTARQISYWVVAPYKKPERDLPDNEKFNNHVSMVRIRSEHAIGFLKGRFQSLKGLRISIKDERSHKFATYWVAACIGIHTFAMSCEAEEQEEDDNIGDADLDFIEEGLSDTDDDGRGDGDGERPSLVGSSAAQVNRARLASGNRRREELKQALLRSRLRRRQEREE